MSGGREGKKGRMQFVAVAVVPDVGGGLCLLGYLNLLVETYPSSEPSLQRLASVSNISSEAEL